MYDHTTERVAYVMHDERLARVSRNLRVAEAEVATKRRHKQLVGERYRVVVARLLIALAKRITPLVPSASTTRATPTAG